MWPPKNRLTLRVVPKTGLSWSHKLLQYFMPHLLLISLNNTLFTMLLQQPNQKLFLGSTIEPLAALPAANRKDPQLAPPPITEQDARYGIISLLDRGFIPPGADLTLDPSPVKQRLALIHTAEDRKQERPAIAGFFSQHQPISLITSLNTYMFTISRHFLSVSFPAINQLTSYVNPRLDMVQEHYAGFHFFFKWAAAQKLHCSGPITLAQH